MDILDMLAANEESIGNVYKAYEERFPEYRDFWARLVDDEVEHASRIRKLNVEVKRGLLPLTDRRFKEEAIQTYRQYLEKELNSAQRQDMSLIDALSIALYIEKSLIEHEFFEVFEEDSVEVKALLLGLKAATKAHLSRVQEAWSKNR